MSSTIWTAEELSRNKRRRSGLCWRVTEAQHIKSSMKLGVTPSEHDRLEELLDESKPPYPEECAGLDFLLFTPFRYKAHRTRKRTGSRFRREGQEEGVFYASEREETAIAEWAFYSLLFYDDSPDTPLPANPIQRTAFSVKYRTNSALDLTELPLRKDERLWTDPVNYGPCQALADEARKADIELIKSFSVRCPDGGKNISILSCRAFDGSKPEQMHTWSMVTQQDYVSMTREFPRTKMVFRISDFSDIRLKNLES